MRKKKKKKKKKKEQRGRKEIKCYIVYTASSFKSLTTCHSIAFQTLACST